MLTKITTKRVYEAASDGDGYRILVDRLWPRGISREFALLDEWTKDIAPSPELRKWFGHDPEKFDEFTASYLDELASSPAATSFLDTIKHKKTVTLLYGAKDPAINHAAILRQYLSKRLADS